FPCFLGGRLALIAFGFRPPLAGSALQRLGLGRRRAFDAAGGLGRLRGRQSLETGAFNQTELNAPGFKVYPSHLYLHGVGETISYACTFPAELMSGLVVLEVVGPPLGTVHQALNEQR